MSLLARLKERARALKRELVALWLAARDARTPWRARILVGAILAYALSPVDLIPDFIPVLGLLDELLLLPAAIWLALRMIPAAVMTDARQRAAQVAARPRSVAGAVVIVLLWVVLAVWLGRWAMARFG